MAKKSASINLLKSNDTFLDKFVNWALSIGRVIVILTEGIALLAFLYRFSLDRQLIDIHSKIKQEEAVLGYLKDNETTFRNLQNRIIMGQTLSKQGKTKIDILTNIVGFAGSGVSFNTIAVQEERVRIDANGNSVQSISDFIEKLRDYSAFSSVSLDKIENRPSLAQINISITCVLKNEITR